MRISIKIDSAAASGQLRRWGGRYREKVKHAVALVMREHLAPIKDDVRKHVAGQLSVVKRVFVKGFYAKVINRDRARLPALYVGSKIPWVGIHERGGSVNAKMLIPIGSRIGRKRFKALVTKLMRAGNAYFVKNAKGHVVLMAENIKEHDKPLARFKRQHRKASDIKKLKRGADIPIAVLVPRVRLKRRLDVTRVVASHIPALAASIEKRLRVI